MRVAPIMAICGIITAVTSLYGGPAQPQSLACHHIHQNNDPGLPEFGGNVIYRQVQLDSGSGEYLLRTYSDQGLSGSSPAEYCFRYELENAGSVPMALVKWPLAGIQVGTLHPGKEHRRSMTSRERSENLPLDIDSPVFAFERRSSKTRAWVTRQRMHLVSDAKKLGSLVPQTYSRPEDIIDGLPLAWSQIGVSAERLQTFHFKEENTHAPPSETTYSAADVYFSVHSVAFADKGEVAVSAKIRADGSKIKGIYAPFLNSEDVAEKEGLIPINTRAIYDFGRIFASYKEAPQSSSNFSEVFSHRSKLMEGSELRVFSVQHPVTIQYADSADCILVQTLSRWPLTYNLDHCAKVP